MSWNHYKYKKSASMDSPKQMYWYETCSHRHSLLQQPYSLHNISLTFYSQLNSAHLGAEWLGEVIVIKYLLCG